MITHALIYSHVSHKRSSFDGISGDDDVGESDLKDSIAAAVKSGVPFVVDSLGWPTFLEWVIEGGLPG